LAQELPLLLGFFQEGFFFSADFGVLTELLFERGFFPATAVDPSLLTEGTLTADMFDVWAAVSEANAVGHWLDWTAPDIAANIQELMGKVVTPEQFVADVEADYTAH